MTKTIRLFMWGYQQHYLISAKVAAEGIFDKLDPLLRPRVFLVGVLHDDRDDRYPICLEPEDCGYTTEAFANIHQIAAQNEQLDSERLIMHSHPIAQEQNRKRLKLRALMEAVKSVIDSYSVLDEFVTRVSWPVLVERYYVFVVLQFQRKALDNHYSLQKDTIDGRYHLPTSLIEETASRYLSACARALHLPDAGSGLGIVGDYDEIIKSAGENLMQTPAHAGGSLRGVGGLFGACNIIAHLRYEGAEGRGKLAVARKSHPSIKEVVNFETPIQMRDHRAVRKLLQLASDELVLLSDSYEISGLGVVRPTYNHKNEDLFVINFLGGSSWELTHAGHSLMQVNLGQPKLRSPSHGFNRFAELVDRIFGEMKDREVRLLWELVEEAGNQNHGALLVISLDAHHEAERLASQSIRISPLYLTPNLVRDFTSIDGAVLIDESGNCHALGVILDGQATSKGDPARGSRFNSALRYVESVSTPCIAVVVSVDGSIDLIPDLKPRISRSSIEGKMVELRGLLDSEDFDTGEFNQLLSWFSDHRFYLLPEMCKEINEIKQSLENQQVEPMAIRLVIDDFLPNPDMNESYFTD